MVHVLQIEFVVPCVVFEKNALIGFEFMACARMTGTKQLFVNKSLSVFSDGEDVGDKRCVQ